MTKNKAVYTAPKLVELGTFEELTQATFSGEYADATILAGHHIPGHQSNVS